MKLELENISYEGDRLVTKMEHNGTVIHWNCKLIEKASFDSSFDLFRELNGFWERLHPMVQDKIFEIYQRIYFVLENLDDTGVAAPELYELVKALYDCHDPDHNLEALNHYLYFRTDIVDPPNLEDTFVENNDSSKTPERTYTRPQYRDLVTMAVALRAMIPVWGEFINRTYKEAGTIWKEYKAAKLLGYSHLWTCAPMKKLRVYIEAFIPTDKLPVSAIVEGLSSEDYPEYIMALVLVRRVCLGDISGRNTEVNMVSFIHRFIGAKIKGQDNSFGGSIKEKNVEGSSQESENNHSRLEAYKMKPEIAAGDIAIIAYPLEQPLVMAQRLRPTITPELLNRCLENSKAMDKLRISEAQMNLIQLVLADEVPPPGMYYMDKKLCLNAMAITQAVLWDAGYFEIAALVSAKTETATEVMQLGAAGTGVARSKILKEQEAALDLLYPHSKRLPGKQKAKQNNPAFDNVKDLAAQFFKQPWKLNLPQDWIDIVSANKNTKQYNAPLDLHVRLADLALQIATRSLYNHV